MKKHPPYHLRPNKAVDRYMLIESLRRIAGIDDLSNYRYYSLGGPYLEDFRLLHEHFPKIKMYSIEMDEDTCLRAKFNRPCGRNISILRQEIGQFIQDFDPKGKKSIFWLDYDNLEYTNFINFQSLLPKLLIGSVIKITLPAEPREYGDKPEEFKMKFSSFMPNPEEDPPILFTEYVALLQYMARYCAEHVLPVGSGQIFQPLTSFYYTDGYGMYTLTGIISMEDNIESTRRPFATWRFANLNWAPPRRINMPFLSTKERLHLQKYLPCNRDPGATLSRALGYSIDGDAQSSKEKMKQYADFYNHYPTFIRGMP